MKTIWSLLCWNTTDKLGVVLLNTWAETTKRSVSVDLSCKTYNTSHPCFHSTNRTFESQELDISESEPGAIFHFKIFGSLKKHKGEPVYLDYVTSKGVISCYFRYVMSERSLSEPFPPLNAKLYFADTHHLKIKWERPERGQSSFFRLSFYNQQTKHEENHIVLEKHKMASNQNRLYLCLWKVALLRTGYLRYVAGNLLPGTPCNISIRTVLATPTASAESDPLYISASTGYTPG